MAHIHAVNAIPGFQVNKSIMLISACIAEQEWTVTGMAKKMQLSGEDATFKHTEERTETHACDLISRREALDALEKEKPTPFVNKNGSVDPFGAGRQNQWYRDGIAIMNLPAAEPTLRERALMLLLEWAVECDFGYDSFPEEYERYKDEIEDMSYFDGMIYIAEKEVERND